jgi:hypothetical protein
MAPFFFISYSNRGGPTLIFHLRRLKPLAADDRLPHRLVKRNGGAGSFVHGSAGRLGP